MELVEFEFESLELLSELELLLLLLLSIVGLHMSLAKITECKSVQMIFTYMISELF